MEEDNHEQTAQQKESKDKSVRLKNAKLRNIIIAAAAALLLVVLVVVLVAGTNSFPTVDNFAKYFNDKGLTSAYEEPVTTNDSIKISKYYKGASLYEAYYISYVEYTSPENSESAAEVYTTNTDYYRANYANIDFDQKEGNSGRFHATNDANGEVYVFYKENNIITIIGNTNYSEEMANIVSELHL